MKLVIFDCDGTLVDSQHIIFAAMRRAFAEQGLACPPAAEVRSVVGLSLPNAIGQLAPAAGADVVGALVEGYKTAFGALRKDPAHEEPLYPGARESIEALAARGEVLLGIATGKSRRGVAHVLARHGLERYFITMQTADVHPSKPHPAMVEYAMAEAGVRPEDTAVVGDTRYDMIMARAAGAAAVGAGWGYHTIEDLQSAGAHAIAADFAQLGGVLEALLFQSEDAL